MTTPGPHDQSYQYPPSGPPPAQWSTPYPQYDPYARPVVTDADRTWAAGAHAGSFLAAWIALGVLCPVLVLVAKGQSPYVRHHAYESLNFQLNALIWIAVSTVLALALIGIPMLVVVGIAYLVLVIRAAVAANNGEWYRYPAIFRFFRP